jgi:alpha-tubulin suppressor-like RCC1 family protein
VLLWDARTHSEGGLHVSPSTKDTDHTGSGSGWRNVKRIDVASLALPPAAPAAPATSSRWWWPFGGAKSEPEKIVQVECGSGHVAMVTSRGRLLMMGDNNYGQVRRACECVRVRMS